MSEACNFLSLPVWQQMAQVVGSTVLICAAFALAVGLLAASAKGWVILIDAFISSKETRP